MPSSDKKSVLVVDDDRDIRTTLKMLLTKENLNVLTAADGFEALETLKSHPIDLVITDIKMPGIDGVQLIETIKNHDEFIQTIVMTGFTDKQSANTFMRKYGILGFLFKPFENTDRLLELVDEALERRSENKSRSTD